MGGDAGRAWSDEQALSSQHYNVFFCLEDLELPRYHRLMCVMSVVCGLSVRRSQVAGCVGREPRERWQGSRQSRLPRCHTPLPPPQRAKNTTACIAVSAPGGSNRRRWTARCCLRLTIRSHFEDAAEQRS
jgi:hypothetical protein